MLALGAAALLGLVMLALAAGIAKLERYEDFLRSAAGGLSVAFVMLDLFVELAASPAQLHTIVRAGPEPVHTIAVLLLVGTIGTFVLASWMQKHENAPSTYMVALSPHLGYLVLVGAALVEEAHDGFVPLLLFWIAMAIHLSVVEHGFVERFPDHHGIRSGALSFVALVAGAALWTLAAPDAAVFNLVLALVAGATLLVVFREELPSPQKTRISGVLLGAGTFTLLQELRWWL